MLSTETVSVSRVIGSNEDLLYLLHDFRTMIKAPTHDFTFISNSSMDTVVGSFFVGSTSAFGLWVLAYEYPSSKTRYIICYPNKYVETFSGYIPSASSYSLILSASTTSASNQGIGIVNFYGDNIVGFRLQNTNTPIGIALGDAGAGVISSCNGKVNGYSTITIPVNNRCRYSMQVGKINGVYHNRSRYLYPSPNNIYTTVLIDGTEYMEFDNGFFVPT